ncbi:MAG: WD40 repeat domain-containing protein [Planctomycetes bacterium]|nr:WD40 repeat domain-containing protein [Planctomycetota bacterium]
MDGAELDRLATPARVLCARFDPSGARLATGHEDATVRLWDARTFEQIGHARVSPSLFDQERDVNSVAFTLDGSRLAYAACEAVGIGVLDSATGVVLREPEDGDGHWCEPVGLLLDRDASNVWWSEGCGGGAIERVSLDRPSHVLPISGATPRANASGRAVIASGLGIACFDVARGRVIWVRPTHVGTDVIQAQSGHFGVLPLDPEALYVDRKRNGAVRDPVWWHARTLFDPKRVRASLAGVELVLWRY